MTIYLQKIWKVERGGDLPHLEICNKQTWNTKEQLCDIISFLENLLGSGKFGEVYLAEASGVIVPDSKGRLRLKYISNSIGINQKGEKCRMKSKVAVKKLKRKWDRATNFILKIYNRNVSAETSGFLNG